MNNYDRQRKDKLIATLPKAREDADRFLMYVVEDDHNAAEVESVRDAQRHITWALKQLTEVKP